jgi:ferredoxin
MHLSSITLVYFSPTKTTQKVLEAIARGAGSHDVEHINVTSPDSRSKSFSPFSHELVMLGAPVYAGRLPKEAVRRISRLKGHHTPAVVVVLYGNREYEDALLELKDLAQKLGFVPIAAGAFIGEHSYTTSEFPIAVGRPNAQDLQTAMEFGKALRQKMASIKNLQDAMPVTVPGDFPYRDGMPVSEECPDTMEEICIACGTCAEVCPMAAVTLNEKVETEPKRCIICCACVKSCPTHARIMAEPRVQRVAKWLNENCSVPKQPETFL